MCSSDLRNFDLHPERIGRLRRHTHDFLMQLERIRYDYWEKIPVLIDWNLGNFSVDRHADGSFHFFSRWDYDWFRIEPRLLELARVLEMPFATRLKKIILPAALGRITVGLRVAISISLVVAVTVEIVINPRGLGYSMIMAQQTLKPDLMYAQLLWLGVLGWALNAVLQKVVSLWPGMNDLGGQS